jgi:hypothetical protein
MKRLFSILMIVAVLASAFLFNVSKASAASYPTLVDTHFVYGKGIAFVFDTNGMKVRAPNLRGSVLYLHGNSYPLACWVNNIAGTIVCTVRGGLTEFAGDQGSVSLLGRLYSVIIPSRPEAPPVEICIECCIQCDK